jgi:hypothetical protein
MSGSDETVQTILPQLRQISQRQEAIVMAVNANTDSIRALGELVEQVVAWMNEPPSTDLADAIKAMTGAMRAVEKALGALPQQIADAVVRRLEAK